MPYGLYLHIPFCVQKCAYCDFLSFPATDAVREAYVDALIEELALYAGETVDTVFLGGGTPSVLTATQTERILNAVFRQYTVEKNVEITMELNPATADSEKLSAYRAMGINRISVGVQSFDDAELSLLGRIHTAKDAAICIEDIHRADFNNFNIDLMCGIPQQSLAGLQRSLNKAISFAPTHMSVYSLMIEPDTPFETRYFGRPELLPDEETERAMTENAVSLLRANGYEHYEVSNYAKAGFACRHNLKYWRCEPYLAAGLGAHAFMHGIRRENVRDLKTYLARIEAKKSPEQERTVLTQADRAAEYCMMTLRLKEGMSLSAFSEKSGYDFLERHQEKLALYQRGGFMQIKGDRLSFTEKGIQVSNSILCEFI